MEAATKWQMMELWTFQVVCYIKLLRPYQIPAIQQVWEISTHSLITKLWCAWLNKLNATSDFEPIDIYIQDTECQKTLSCQDQWKIPYQSKAHIENECPPPPRHRCKWPLKWRQVPPSHNKSFQWGSNTYPRPSCFELDQCVQNCISMIGNSTCSRIQ